MFRHEKGLLQTRFREAAGSLLLYLSEVHRYRVLEQPDILNHGCRELENVGNITRNTHNSVVTTRDL
jgi:hypothetical protein